MPEAIDALEVEAGALQGTIDLLRATILEERGRLRDADANIKAIADEFKRLLVAVSFPGVEESDVVVLEPRDWKPKILHGLQEWSFWEAGSGGKKTLFYVCYAFAFRTQLGCVDLCPFLRY